MKTSGIKFIQKYFRSFIHRYNQEVTPQTPHLYVQKKEKVQHQPFTQPLVNLFHISPNTPAPLGMVCSSKLALRAAARSLAGSRFMLVILLNFSPDWVGGVLVDLVGLFLSSGLVGGME